MKTTVTVYFWYGSHMAVQCWPVARELLLELGREDLANRGKRQDSNWDFCFDENDPRLHHLRDRLTQLQAQVGICWRQAAKAIYTPEEIRAAPLLLLRYLKKPRGYGGAEHGTEFDVSNACPECGTGAVQVSPLFLDPKDFPKKGNLSYTFTGEMLVSEDLRKALEDQRPNSVELRRAVAVKKGPMPWFQIIAPHFLPPMSPSTKGVIRSNSASESPCPICHRDGFFRDLTMPTQIVYDATKVKLDALPDAMRTWEGFGKSGINEGTHIRWFAEHKLIVKQRIREIFEQMKVIGVEFEPVTVQ